MKPRDVGWGMMSESVGSVGTEKLVGNDVSTTLAGLGGGGGSCTWHTNGG